MVGQKFLNALHVEDLFNFCENEVVTNSEQHKEDDEEQIVVTDGVTDEVTAEVTEKVNDESTNVENKVLEVSD